MKKFHTLTCLAMAGALYLTPQTGNGQWTNVGPAGFSAGDISYPSIALGSDGAPYVTYKDMSVSGKATAMKYDGTAWVGIGTAGFTPDAADFGSLAIGPGDHLYYSFHDASVNQLSVMHFDGTSWSNVGAAGISTGSASYTCMEVNNSGTPYVAYIDAATGRACVKTFDGTNWINTGATAEVSPGSAGYLSMDLDAAGYPWIAFSDGTVSNNLTVMQYNGSSWSTVGTAGFSSSLSGIIFADLTISPSDEAFVAFSNPFAGVVSSVMKYNGSAWINIGPAGFNANNSIFNTVTINTDGTPFLAYMDGSTSSKGSVMAYDDASSTWAYLGASGFTGTGAGYMTSVMDGNTYLYVTSIDGDEANKISVWRYQLCTPGEAIAAFSPTAVCEGDTVTLDVSGALNGDSFHAWYTGSCKGTSIGTGSGIEVVITDTTVFYSNAEGGCVFAGDTCTTVTVYPFANPAIPVISTAGVVMTSSAASGNQWYFNGSLIPGATASTHTATANGSYTVVVTNANGCSSSSAPVVITTTGISTLSSSGVSVFPMPFSQVLNIQSDLQGNSQVNIHDLSGSLVYSGTIGQQLSTLDLSALAPGLYVLSLQNSQSMQTFSVIKQ